MIVGFTGSRPQKIGGFKTPNPTYNYICSELEKALLELKPDKAISGMALGFDSIAAETCIKLGITFIAACPFKDQDAIWPAASRKKYLELLAQAERVECISPGGYAAYKMQVRNEWLVERSDVLIVCFDGSAGGTKNCFDYAVKQNKSIIKINPLAWNF